MKFSLDKHLDVDLQYIFGSKWNVNAEDLQNYEAVIKVIRSILMCEPTLVVVLSSNLGISIFFIVIYIKVILFLTINVAASNLAVTVAIIFLYVFFALWK